jgi:hypothetical protein
MSKAKASLRFFRKLYVPPLLKAKDARAQRVDAGMKATRMSFTNMPKEELHALAVRGGLARQKLLTPEARRMLALKARDGYMKLPPARRKEVARQAVLTQWANMTPEHRAKRIAMLTENRLKATRTIRGKREPKWPFPEGMKRRLTIPELNIRRVKKWRLKKFLKQTSKV